MSYETLKLMLQYDKDESDMTIQLLRIEPPSLRIKEDVEMEELIEWGGESFGMYTVAGAKAVADALEEVQDRNDLSRSEKLTRIQNSVSRLGHDEIGFSEPSYLVWEYLGNRE